MTGRGFSSEFLTELKNKNDIVDVISKYVPLSRKGRNYWARCPFHGEKTPSFSIKDDSGYYKCFGCGDSGDVVTFIMKIENVDFITAVEILAKNVGMQVPAFEGADETREKKKLRDAIYSILSDTTAFYSNNLKSGKASTHSAYVRQRGISPEMIEKFKIGASLDFKGLPQYLLSKGYSDDILVEAGVVGKNNDGELFDFYAGRLIFPIFNGLGDVVGFSGRDITGSEKVAKYKNTPQTFVFTKGQNLYGFNFLREYKKNNNLEYIIMVEGQMDVIACHSAGLVNTIGCMGTALTQSHARDLSRLCDNIILCLDGDGAGKTATYKDIEILREIGMNVKVLRLTETKDPDEFLKKFGATALKEKMKQSIPCIEFILKDISTKYNLSDYEDKNKYIKDALNYISRLSTPAEQEIYLKYIQSLTKVPIDALRRSLTGNLDIEAKTKEEPDIKIDNVILTAKICLLANFLYQKQEFDFEKYEKFFKSGDEKEIFEYLKLKKQNNEKIIPSALFDDFEVEDGSVLDKVLNFKFSQDDNINKVYFKECENKLKDDFKKQRKAEILKQILLSKDEQEREELLKELQQLENEGRK